MRLPDYVWTRSVRKQMRHRRKEVQPVSSSVGYATIQTTEEKKQVIVSSVVGENGLRPLICRVMAAGAEPMALTGTFLLPEGTPEQVLRSRMVALEKECAAFKVEIMQMEVSHSGAVTEPVMQVTLIGKKRAEGSAFTGQAHPGQMIVMSGYAGIEGMQKCMKENRTLLEEYFPSHYLYQAEKYVNLRLPTEECQLAGKYGVTAVQAAGEGGIYDALWQLGEATGAGMEIELYQIPLRQETVEIAERFDLDPYRMDAGGAFLMVTEQGEELVEQLSAAQIPAAVIGQIRQGKDRVILFHEERRFLEPYR